MRACGGRSSYSNTPRVTHLSVTHHRLAGALLAGRTAHLRNQDGENELEHRSHLLGCPPTGATPLETEHHCRGGQCNMRLRDNQDLLHICCACCIRELFRRHSVSCPDCFLPGKSVLDEAHYWVRCKHSGAALRSHGWAQDGITVTYRPILRIIRRLGVLFSPCI